MPKIVHRIDGAITQDKKVLKYLSLKCYRRVDESKNNVTKWTFDLSKTCVYCLFLRLVVIALSELG